MHTDNPKYSQVQEILQKTLEVLGESTIAEREVVYKFAREVIADLSQADGLGAPRGFSENQLELEFIISRIEAEYLIMASNNNRLSFLPEFPPELQRTSASKNSSEANMISDGRSHEQTQRFLKNIGVGGSVSIVKILVQLALLPLMAHLLGPKEFGIYALAVPVVGFLALIADGGVGLSLAREQTNAPAIWSTAFWVLIASGFVLSGAVASSGYLLSYLSSEPQLCTLMLILSISFPFLSLAVLPIARLTRSGNLVPCAVADFVSTMAGAICAVTLGMMGYGAKSLAYQFLTIYVLRAAILNAYAFERPLAIFRPSAMLSHLSSGGILMGGRVVDLACRSGESLLFGNAFGPATLGAYNFANQVPRFLFEAFSNPSWSALYTQSLSEQHKSLLNFYYKVSRLMAFVTFPTAAVLTAASPEILAQVLGPKWHEAGVYLRILAPGYALSITASMGTAIILALNANYLFFVTTVILGVGRVAAVAAGYYLPVSETVWLVTASNVVYAALVILIVVRVADVRFRNIVKELAGSIFSAFASGGLCWLILELFGGGVVTLLSGILASIICYFAAIFLIEGDNIKDEISFLKAASSGLAFKRI